MKLTLKHELRYDSANIEDVFYLADKYGDLYVDFEPKLGSPYFLVYAVYGGGDSFTPAKPQFVELLDLFEEANLATELTQCVSEHYNRYREGVHGRTIEPLTWEEQSRIYFNGKEYRTPWNGYFEELYEVNLKVVYFAGKKITLV